MIEAVTIIEAVDPPIPRDMRLALIEAGIVDTHKDAQEKFIEPYMAKLALREARQARIVELRETKGYLQGSFPKVEQPSTEAQLEGISFYHSVLHAVV